MKKISIAALLIRLLAAIGLAAGLAACGSIKQEDAGAQQVTPPVEQTTTIPVDASRVPEAVTNVQPSASPVRTDAVKPAAPAPAPAPALADARRMAKESERAGMQAKIAAAPMPFSPHGYEPQPQEREKYKALSDNPVHLAAETPVSTFSIDVDTGSYSNVRRFLNQGRLPPSDAVRVEELVNYFPYDYALPQDGRPFAVHTELSAAPWSADKVLMRIGIKGQDIAKQNLPPANLVFLVDVSGSMNSNDKLPLLRSSLKLLVNEMSEQRREQDHITLVTYAGTTAVTLPPTSLKERGRILAAIDGLNANGSTNGASGIALAYQMAQQGFIKGGINRILLATDGDFNVGITSFEQLKNMVEEKRKSGVSLSTLGFGTGNYNEQLMEQLADAGDGAYSYIDNLMEGHKVLVNEMTSSLATIARDVKIQVEFNPATVKEYRLVGYENRLLAREDFNNDKVDAGDIGAGHTVTALYELTLNGQQGLVDPLRYGVSGAAAAVADRKAVGIPGELAHIKLRYKQPDLQTSTLMDTVVRRDAVRPLKEASNEFRFATAVAGYGQLLRGGKYAGQWSYADARTLAASSIGADRYGYRGEFLRLVDLAQALSTRTVAARE
ncbi:VWA domain-containing protein [Uliginosibacterium sp. H3]|uniref:VWA domain-containing protein n=1 Tax=Uliginosibacterium silvisoli TaxID=3114758 RepID=A0ABU6K132_9RHOO|nr:VWA domain-containing protein [Uliginosibacterium sp. H3]